MTSTGNDRACKQLENWLLENYGRERFRPKLAEVSRALSDYDFQLSKIKVITVGGTNGKGTTCDFLAQMLEPARITYGMWTSPHVYSLTERFVFNGKKIELAALVASCQRIHKKQYQLSYYEFLFIVFIDLACATQLDVLILEVGLGGRYDAVNAIDADLTAIVSISRDHTEILGRNYRDILLEKIQIARAGRDILTYFQLKYLNELTAVYTKKLQANWVNLSLGGNEITRDDYISHNQIIAENLYSRLCKLIKREQIESFPRHSRLAGRGAQIRIGEHQYCFHGAHNLDGARKLVQFLAGKTYNNNVLLVLGFSQRDLSEIEYMLAIYSRFFSKGIVAKTFDHPRALSTVQDLKMPVGFELREDWREVLISGKETKEFFISGSFYFMGEVLHYLQSSNH